MPFGVVGKLASDEEPTTSSRSFESFSAAERRGRLRWLERPFSSVIIASLECVIASYEETVAAEGRKVVIHFVGFLHVMNMGPY